VNDRSRNRSVVATHSLSLDMRLCLGLWRHPQFWRYHQRKPRPPPLRPPRPRRRPPIRSSLGQSAVRNGEPGEQNAARNAAPDAQNDGSSGAQDVTSDETRATAPPPPLSKKSNNLFAPTTASGPAAWAVGRPCRRRERGARIPSRASARQRLSWSPCVPAETSVARPHRACRTGCR
jgi:hypothetical protein